MVIKHDGPDNAATTRDHVDQLNNITAERDGLHVPEVDSTGYRIREEPFGTRRKVRVVLMGAGASTVNFLKKAEESVQNLEVIVYEKNHDIGGTWLENRYPGCACDVCRLDRQSGASISPKLIKKTDPLSWISVHVANQNLEPFLLLLTRDLRIPENDLRRERFHQQVRQVEAQDRARPVGRNERCLEVPRPRYRLRRRYRR